MPHFERPKLRGFSHLIGFFVAVGASSLLIARAVMPVHQVAAVIFSLGMSLMLGTSAIYHRIQWATEASRARMRAIDHSMIFIFTAATATALGLMAMHGTVRMAALAFVWTASAGGIAMVITRRNVPRIVTTGSYLVIGWSGLFLLPTLYSSLDHQTFSLLVSGGALYSFGAVVYLFKRPDPFPRIFGFHEIFHLFVIAAAVCHYTAVWNIATVAA